MSNNRKLVLAIMGIVVLLGIIIGITYAFFTSSASASNNILYNITFNETNYNFTVTLNNTSNTGGTMSISFEDVYYNGNNTVAGSYSNALDISFTNNSNEIAKCTYDYIWVWDNNFDNYTISSGATKEYTVSALNTGEVQVPNYNASSFVIGSGYIMANANSTSIQTDPFTVQMYNLSEINQQTHKGKNYRGYLTIAHVNCGSETTYTLADYISYLAPKSGTDAVSNSPWILTSDHGGEWRYAGKNPNNYISFNGELWRIIGVMTNMEYCTGTYGQTTECDTKSTGGLVKIVRNDSLGNFMIDGKYHHVGSSMSTGGSEDWSDSQLMLMLNGTNYLKNGYDVDGNKLHTNYTITNNIVAGNGHNYYNATYSYLDGSGTTVYIPSEATSSRYTAVSGTLPKKITSSALNQIATVRWDLYGTGGYSTSTQGYYDVERNINNLGAVFIDESLPEKFPAYWYGKVALLYVSDYGYATNGGNTYDRNTCIDYTIYGSSYYSECAINNYLLYLNITSTAPSSRTEQWTMDVSTNNDFHMYVKTGGYIYFDSAKRTHAVRPTLYLKTDTQLTGGNGTWNNPYTIA